MKLIISENPSQMIWQILLRYTYTDIINNWWKERGKTSDDNLALFISSSFLQAKSYFDAALNAQINILPLLLYYASVNLLIGTLTLIKQRRFVIKNHGMILDEKTLTESGNILPISLVPRDKNGALNVFASEMAGIADLLDRGSWSLEDVFRTIPDLILEYQFLFPNSDVNVVQVEEIDHNGIILDRIPIDNLEYGKVIIQRLSLNEKFSDTYLKPQISQPLKYVILNRKPGSTTFEQYSMVGERYLPIPYSKRKGNIFLPQFLMMYLGLFILGTLSRYHPVIWDSFIRNDTSGKKNLINNFLLITERYFPNLILNTILGERVQFKI